MQSLHNSGASHNVIPARTLAARGDVARVHRGGVCAIGVDLRKVMQDAVLEGEVHGKGAEMAPH